MLLADASSSYFLRVSDSLSHYIVPASTVIHSADIHSSFCLKAITAVRCKDASHIWGERDVVLGLARMVAKLCSLLMFVSKHRQNCTTCPKEKTESSGQAALKQRLTFD